MLSQRRRFNYNVGSVPSVRNSRSKNKLITACSINPPVCHVSRDENLRASKVVEVKESSKRVQQLEAVNKKLIEETTQQFKRLESDVQRVERILEEKESHIIELQDYSKNFNSELGKAGEEKKLLIEAIFQKDLVIKEYEAKLTELLESQNRGVQEVPVPVETDEAQLQTDPLPETCLKSEVISLEAANGELQEELYHAKQELFDAQNRIKLLIQEFDAYKLLKEIQSVQEI